MGQAKEKLEMGFAEPIRFATQPSGQEAYTNKRLWTLSRGRARTEQHGHSANANPHCSLLNMTQSCSPFQALLSATSSRQPSVSLQEDVTIPQDSLHCFMCPHTAGSRQGL